MTNGLLTLGMGSAVLFVAVLTIEGHGRAGYNPAYHTGSELQLGPRGWVQVVNFLQMGAGTAAFSLGVYRVLGSVAAAVLLAIFSIGMVVAGVMIPAPDRGYPPGARSDDVPGWRHRLHHVVGGPASFLAIFGACIAVSLQTDGFWRVYSLFTAAIGIFMTAWTAIAYQRDAANTGLVQRGLILVYWTWIVAIGAYLLTASD